MKIPIKQFKVGEKVVYKYYCHINGDTQLEEVVTVAELTKLGIVIERSSGQKFHIGTYVVDKSLFKR